MRLRALCETAAGKTFLTPTVSFLKPTTRRHDGAALDHDRAASHREPHRAPLRDAEHRELLLRGGRRRFRRHDAVARRRRTRAAGRRLWRRRPWHLGAGTRAAGRRRRWRRRLGGKGVHRVPEVLEATPGRLDPGRTAGGRRLLHLLRRHALRDGRARVGCSAGRRGASATLATALDASMRFPSVLRLLCPVESGGRKAQTGPSFSGFVCSAP